MQLGILGGGCLVCVLVTKLCPVLATPWPVACSASREIFQARILECVAISFSRWLLCSPLKVCRFPLPPPL